MKAGKQYLVFNYIDGLYKKMSNRIEYIDQLKGFAIILVVMGHVAEKSMNITTTPFNEFYGSFHIIKN